MDTVTKSMMDRLGAKPPKGLRVEPTTAGQVQKKKPEPKFDVGPIGEFMERNYLHYNARTTLDAAQAFVDLLDDGGKMFISLAGAMSTAELGISLAEMIRQGKIHGVSCTGANLEEDLFNLVAHSKYLHLPSWRGLSTSDDEALLEASLPRVTDTCIPEHAAMEMVSHVILALWKKSKADGKSYFPHEYLYQILREGKLKKKYEIDPKNSWLLAAAEKDIPIYVPGWEDSTLGNMFAACCIEGDCDQSVVKGGIQYMMHLCEWYEKNSGGAGIGFFQIGGGIAGDFSICAVPLLKIDLKKEKETPLWSYFCQISESNASYGGYSGAEPNEKITWYKLGQDTPRFVIESDATIVAPLIFSYVLGL
jgi:deoxyhypusine synthase